MGRNLCLQAKILSPSPKFCPQPKILPPTRKITPTPNYCCTPKDCQARLLYCTTIPIRNVFPDLKFCPLPDNSPPTQAFNPKPKPLSLHHPPKSTVQSLSSLDKNRKLGFYYTWGIQNRKLGFYYTRVVLKCRFGILLGFVILLHLIWPKISLTTKTFTLNPKFCSRPKMLLMAQNFS